MKLLRWPLALLRLLGQCVLLALGEIAARKARSILTTMGIVIGVAAVAGVIAALTGLRANVLREIEAVGANKIYLHADRPESGPKQFASWRSLRFRPEQFDGLLEHCPSVSDFTRVAWRRVPLRRGRHSGAASLMGVEPGWHKIQNRSVTLGRPLSLIDNAQGRCVCLISPQVRDDLRLGRDCIGQQIYVADRGFVVVGVVEAAAEGADRFDFGREPGREVLIPFNTFWRLYPRYMWVLAASRTPELSGEAQAELRFFLRRRRSVKPGEPDTFFLWAMQSLIERFEKVSAMLTWIVGGVAGISLLVGGVGIMNMTLVSVSERTREIGLRKAVGARPSAICIQFLVEAVVLCLIGGLIGVLVGQGFVSALACIPETHLKGAHVPPWAVALSFGFAAGVGVLFGMIPAVKAARLDPAAALRHE